MRGLRIEGFQEERWQEIVKGVDVELDRGQVLGLIGESGAGKSTIGIASMGFCRPGCRITGGSITFDDIELDSAGDEALRQLRGVRISYVAQSAAASFNPAHRLIAQYVEAPVQHGVLAFSQAEREAKQIYGKLDLPDPEIIGNRYPHQVSGGQLQRAMVAMAMACKPDLIVFDEPTTALDVTTQIEVLAAIKDAIRERNTAAIYISHDLAVVAQVSDRIMVLRYGETIEVGNARQMIAAPREDYTQALLSVRKVREDKVRHPEEGETLLEVRDVSASYGGPDGVPVLEDITLDLTRCNTIAVVGESGSGKSTLARAITGLLPPTKGSIVFEGKTLPASFKQRDKEMLRRLQMIYQMPDVALNPRQKVDEVLGRPLSFYFGMEGKERHERVVELLDQIELNKKYLDRFPPSCRGARSSGCASRARLPRSRT